MKNLILLLLSCVSLSAAFTQNNPLGKTYGDGIHDDTAALQEILDGASVNGGTVTIPPHTFVIKHPLYIRDGINIQGLGASVIKNVVYPGAWLDYQGTNPNDWMIIVTNRSDLNVQANVQISGLGLRCRTLANGVLIAPSPHPQAQHGIKLSMLNIYQARKAMSWGEGPTVTDNQSDYVTIDTITADEFSDCVFESYINNLTTAQFINIRGTCTSTTLGTSFKLHAGSLGNFIGCATAFGNIFVQIDGIVGAMGFYGCQWEQSAAATKIFANIEAPFGNSTPITFTSCYADNSIIRVAQNERVIDIRGSRFFGGRVQIDANSVQVIDFGNARTKIIGAVTNPNFTNSLTGWTQSNWTRIPGPISTGAAQHTVGFTNAISQTISVQQDYKYLVIWNQYGTNGNLRPYFGAQPNVSAYSGNTIASYVYTATNTGTADLLWAPTSDFDGGLISVSYSYYPPDVVDTGVANMFKSDKLLEANPGEVIFGGLNGLITHTNFYRWSPDDNRLIVGDPGHIGRIQVNLFTPSPALLHLAGNDASIITENVAGGAFVGLEGTGSYGLILHDRDNTNKFLFIAAQDNFAKGSATNLTRHTAINYRGHWVMNWDGSQTAAQIENQILWVNGGVRLNDLTADAAITAPNISATTSFYTPLFNTDLLQTGDLGVTNYITANAGVRIKRATMLQANPTTADFNSTNTVVYVACSSNIVLATINRAIDRNFSFLLENTAATNISITYPQTSGTNSWRPLGGFAPTLSAGQFLEIYLEPRGSAETQVIAKITAESQ